METIITTEKPIRYVANDNTGSWVVNLTETGLVTVTCFYMPIANEYYKFITDGLFIDIERFPKGDYLFSGYYEEPTRERKRTYKINRVKTYDEALACSQDWLVMMLEVNSQMLMKYYPKLFGKEEDSQLEMVF